MAESASKKSGSNGTISANVTSTGARARMNADMKFLRAMNSLDANPRRDNGVSTNDYIESQVRAYMRQPSVMRLKAGGKAREKAKSKAVDFATSKWLTRASQLRQAHRNARMS